MQEFKMSLTEIDAKFTKSEMAIMSWSSNEQVLNLEKKTEKSKVKKKKEINHEETSDEDLPPHFYNEEGEIDLRRVTGKEAHRYFASMNIHIPMIRKG